MTDAKIEQLEELRALLAKATDEDLADGGRYFSGRFNNLTECHHGEVGEYQNPHDGPVIEWLWNRRHTLLDTLADLTRERDERDSVIAVLRADIIRNCEAMARQAAEIVELRRQRHTAESALAGAIDVMKAVIANADRPGRRMSFGAGDEEDVWIEHQEVDQAVLDQLSAFIADREAV